MPDALPHVMTTRRHSLAGLLAAVLSPWSVRAASAALAAPKGPVLLTVEGAITESNAGAAVEFDDAMLAALPQHVVVTRTPWHVGPQRFEGPLLRVLLDAVGARGTRIMAHALNGYRCEIPLEDARRHDVIVARLHHGQPMRVRDKGPLFIVYPFDSDPALRADRTYARSAWQLRRLVVLP